MMNWPDEKYVRLYTRDTVTWKRWSWEARAVFGLLLRKVDRSGVLDTGAVDKCEALALILEIPIDVATRALAQWLIAGTVVETSTGLILPSYIEAQEASQSDKVRQSESRAKRRAATMRNIDTACHTVSQPVTDGHKLSQIVTPAVPSQPSQPSQPSRAVPEQKPPLTTAIGWWVAAQDKRAAIPGMVREKPPANLDFWFSEALMHVSGDEMRLMAGYEKFLVDPFWRNEAKQRCGWGGWVKQWRDFVSQGAQQVILTPKAKPGAPAPIPDWSTAEQGEVEP